MEEETQSKTEEPQPVSEPKPLRQKREGLSPVQTAMARLFFIFSVGGGIGFLTAYRDKIGQEITAVAERPDSLEAIPEAGIKLVGEVLEELTSQRPSIVRAPEAAPESPALWETMFGDLFERAKKERKEKENFPGFVFAFILTDYTKYYDGVLRVESPWDKRQYVGNTDGIFLFIIPEETGPPGVISVDVEAPSDVIATARGVEFGSIESQLRYGTWFQEASGRKLTEEELQNLIELEKQALSKMTGLPIDGVIVAEAGGVSKLFNLAFNDPLEVPNHGDFDGKEAAEAVRTRHDWNNRLARALFITTLKELVVGTITEMQSSPLKARTIIDERLALLHVISGELDRMEQNTYSLGSNPELWDDGLVRNSGISLEYILEMIRTNLPEVADQIVEHPIDSSTQLARLYIQSDEPVLFKRIVKGAVKPTRVNPYAVSVRQTYETLGLADLLLPGVDETQR